MDTLAQALECIATDLEYPMVIVTAQSAEDRSGCLVGFNTQCSIDPFRWAVCISKKNHTFGVASHTRRLAVHFLAREQEDLAKLFGEETSDDIDKFAHCEWRSHDGTPVLQQARHWFVGNVLESHDVGDHVCFIVEPDTARCWDHLQQYGFQDASSLEAGHAP